MKIVHTVFVFRNRSRDRYRSDRTESDGCNNGRVGHRKPLRNESRLETDGVRLEIKNRLFLPPTHSGTLLQTDAKARIQSDRKPDGEGRSGLQSSRQIRRRDFVAQT